jgi:ABC-type transport system involved in multi-copper enzyme maturation permease subunit
MTRLVKVELLKLITLRVGYGVLAVSASLTALFASLEASRAGSAGSGVAPLFTASGLSRVTTVTGWSMLFAAVLGVIVSAGEFRHQTATLTHLATPNRSRVLLSKAVVAAGAGAIFGALSALIATGVGLVFVASHGYHVSLAAGTLAAHGAGAVLGAALFGAMGVAVGSLVRSQIAGVIGVFVWALVIESLVGGLFTGLRPYLPYTAATTLAGIKLGSAAFGPANGVAGAAAPLPFAAAAALVAAIFVAVAALVARTTLTKDIT